jgi:hypothetical protein
VLLWYFPVSNKRGHGDPIIKALMATVERLALAEDYIKKPVRAVLHCVDPRCVMLGHKFTRKGWVCNGCLCLLAQVPFTWMRL